MGRLCRPAISCLTKIEFPQDMLGNYALMQVWWWWTWASLDIIVMTSFYYANHTALSSHTRSIHGNLPCLKHNQMCLLNSGSCFGAEPCRSYFAWDGCYQNRPGKGAVRPDKSRPENTLVTDHLWQASLLTYGRVGVLCFWEVTRLWVALSMPAFNMHMHA